MILADGFEDTEALTTRDVLIRAGFEVKTCSISDRLEVESSFGVHVLADALLKLMFDLKPYEFIILPGGGRGTQNLKKCAFLKPFLDYFVSQNKLVCAICAAPSVLGQYGYLKNKKYTCFAGCNEGVDGIFTAAEVERDGNFITARSMHYSIPFALEIIDYLVGAETKEKVLLGLNGLESK